MTNDNDPAKSTVTPRKQATRTPSPPKPQIQPPLSNDGMESVRDSNC